MFRILFLLPLLLLGGCAAEAESPADPTVTVLAEPELPQTAAYPEGGNFIDDKGNFDSDAYESAWNEWQEDQTGRGTADVSPLSAFTRAAVPEILSGEGNRVCSPLNIYLALGMLSEVTDGESRAQILALLQHPDMESLRRNAAELWLAHYRDDGAAVSKLAASFWLRNDMNYNEETLQRLAENYYASAFRGTMGAPETDAALQQWINEQTGSLLAEQAGGLRLSEDTILALVSTIYYSARWSNTFMPEFTEPGMFYTAVGEVDCEFMMRSAPMVYNWGGTFGAVTLGLEEGYMELILPDEGVTPADLLENEEFWAYALGSGGWEQNKLATVDLALPRFDVCSDLDLRQSLRNLGVRDVFTSEYADFSPLSDMAAYLSQVRHAARVKADEEGVEAAAYTVMAVAAAAMPPEERVDFRLDRPFVFLLRGDDGAPLFLGVVETPA